MFVGLVSIVTARESPMDIAGVRELLHRQPFEPFLIRLADGRTLPVPHRDFVALTPRRETARRLALVWGVHPIVTKDASDIDDMAFRACKFAVREGFARTGDRIIVVAGMPFGTPGATNMVRIAFVTQEHAAKA